MDSSSAIGSEDGIVIALDIKMNDTLLLEGRANELQRAIVEERKKRGLTPNEQCVVRVEGFEWTLVVHGERLQKETNTIILPVDTHEFSKYYC